MDFSYKDYQNTVEKAKTNDGSNNLVKVGFFKLKDGEEALVRINCATIEDLKFATVHKPIFGKKFEGLGSGFTPVSCLNELGSYSDDCPFCKAAAAGHDVVAKATKNVYLEMLVAYKDTATGGWSDPVPVVWERPAGYSREIATKLKDFGSLKDIVFKITRMGASKDTRYSLDFIPVFNKPEIIPVDFSAFDNFNIAKVCYWEKSAEDLQTYLNTGVFPVSGQPAASVAPVYTQPAIGQTIQPIVTPAPAPAPVPVQEVAPAPTPVQPKSEFTGSENYPSRNFSGFSF